MIIVEKEQLEALKTAIKEYRDSEGCSCCQKFGEHQAAQKKIDAILGAFLDAERINTLSKELNTILDVPRSLEVTDAVNEAQRQLKKAYNGLKKLDITSDLQ
jgi:hypothetical protein